MSTELSPSQERKLHSILDRGLGTLNESVANISRTTPNKPSQLSNSNRENSPKISDLNKQSEKSKVLNTELKTLQAKLATLEAKFAKGLDKPPVSRPKSPNCFFKKKRNSENSPKGSTSLNKIKVSKERHQSVQKPRESLKNLTKDKPKLLNQVKKDSQDKDLKDSYQKLQQDYGKLQSAFKRSEKIRRKQGDLISKLKKELKKLTNYP